MRLRADQRGSVTAEFAIVVPAVVLVIVLCATTLSAAGRQVRLEQAAAQGARLAARGEAEQRVRSSVAALIDATVDIREDGEYVCVSARARLQALIALTELRAESCVLAGGL